MSKFAMALTSLKEKLAILPYSCNMRTFHSRTRFCRLMQARQRKRDMKGRLGASIKRLKVEMKEISKDQQCIKKNQKQIRDKFQEIRSEYDQLREESKLIALQSNITKTRLSFIFEILRARENKEFDRADGLASSLRAISKCL